MTTVEAMGPDRGEQIAAMEPMTLYSRSRHRPALQDRALEVATASASYAASLPEDLVAPLAGLVRSMNCYYSNIIEGHDTHPVEIERALQGDYSAEPRKRDLQLEAQAHIAVQTWLDQGGARGQATQAATLQTIHRRFYVDLPQSLWRVALPDGQGDVMVTPGAWRDRDVQVGRHVAVSPGAIPRFMARFERSYAGLGRFDALLAAAAAHHRLASIHPFLDGNGRVGRLMSHALMLDHADSRALWSVARGLARREADYKRHLADCDLPPRGGSDGGGALSEEALAQFTAFFLDLCLDQIQFMRGLTAPDRLRERILGWAQRQIALGALPARSDRALKELLYVGRLERAATPGLLDLSDRHARRVTSALESAGAIAADGPKAPFRLAFSARLASAWTPGLFPDYSG